MQFNSLIQQYILNFQDNNSVVKIGIVLFLTVIVSLCSHFCIRAAARRTEKTRTVWDNVFTQSLQGPVIALIWVVGLTLSVEAGIGADAAVAGLVLSAYDLGVVICIAWFLLKFIRLAQNNLIESRLRAGKRVDRSATEGLGKLLRLIVMMITALVTLQTFGFSLAGVLTFGGVGGIAIGFAAKDMLANFFGGLMLYLDRPFAVGDWIRSPDRELEGTVEDIGWRITRIQNFDSRPLYVPNSSFSTITIENVSRMVSRRIDETIGVRYEDAAAVENIIKQVREYLKNHEEIDQTQTLVVSFNTFAASSLDFFVYCFTKTQSFAEFYQIKQQVMLHILKIIENNGAQCAYPTTTLHIQPAEAET